MWDAIDRLCIHDPDDTTLSAPEMQALFARTTIAELRSKLESLRIILCEGEHDDPCSGITRNTCPLRELNLACGHQDLIRTFRPEAKRWQTPLSAILTACHVLYMEGAREEADSFHREARAITDQLYIIDGAGYLSYHRLRNGQIFTHEDLTEFPPEAWAHPLASVETIDELKTGMRTYEADYGTQLSNVRDQVLTMLSERVQSSDQ